MSVCDHICEYHVSMCAHDHVNYYVCKWVHIIKWVQRCLCEFLCFCVCIHVCMCVHLAVCMCACMLGGICLCMWMCIHVFVSMCMSVPCACMCVYTCVFVCIIFSHSLEKTLLPSLPHSWHVAWCLSRLTCPTEDCGPQLSASARARSYSGMKASSPPLSSPRG